MVDWLFRLAENPARAAILLDVDGVLAPIVPRPEDARVPAETQAELRRLAARYALVACISGRSEHDARRVVGLGELEYVGNHGLALAPETEAWEHKIKAFVSTAGWDDVEHKRVSASFHYRRAADERAARQRLDALAEQARADGLVARFGRKVLEVLPPVTANKGTAVAALLSKRGLVRALYAGDDTTDLDAFAAVRALEVGVCVAVTSPEGPTALQEQADLVVATPAELRETVLRRL